MLASYFSQAKESSSVPVDYCPVKFVKKPAGARPGMVTYDNYRTLYVTPDENAPKPLLKAVVEENDYEVKGFDK